MLRFRRIKLWKKLMRGKMTKRFFFDTYALIELSKESQSYQNYRKDVHMILTRLNLMEYSYYLLRVGKKNKIAKVFDELLSFVVSYDNDVLIKAAEMKFKYKKEKLSFVDCIGYLLAKEHKAKFLTGDSKFKDKENVEFVR